MSGLKIVDQCLTTETLADFADGQISTRRALAGIAAHLEQCPACLDAVQTAPQTGAPLVRAIQRGARTTEHESESGCNDALKRVLAIKPRLEQRDQSTQRFTRTIDHASLPASGDCPSGALGMVGPYELLERIGSGGMGVVYKALHTRMNRLVALKMMPADRTASKEALQRFEREMATIGQLTHPNIVIGHDAGDVDGQHFLVMELLDGIDLSALIRRVGPLRIADACEMIRQAANGLQYAHEHGMVHRDIKPSNLMLAEGQASNSPPSQDEEHTLPRRPIIRILDLGLARLDEKDAGDSLTSGQQLMGTLDYMSPEQCLDSRDVDGRSDIYSLAATLYRLLTGSAPWSGDGYDTPGRRFQAILTQQLPSIGRLRSDLPAELVAAIDRALGREPTDRFETPRQFAEALAPFAEGHDLAQVLAEARSSDVEPLTHSGGREPARQTLRDESATPLSAARPTRPWVRLHWLALAGLPIAVLLLGVIWLQTDGGYIRIDAHPEIDISVAVIKGGKPVGSIEVGKTNNEAWYRSGTYEIRLPAAAGDNFQIADNVFTLSRSDNQKTVTITRVTPAERAEELAAAKPTPVSTKVRMVSSNADNGPGSLRQAITDAAPGDTIRFDKLLAGKSIRLASGQLDFEKDLTVDASELETPVTIDGAGLSGVVRCVEGTSVHLKNLVITGGNTAAHGGGITSRARLTLTRVTVTKNTALTYGGGINSAEGVLTLIESTISDNSANVAGGISAWNGSVDIRNSTITGNTGRYRAGGLATFGVCRSSIVNATFSANTSPSGAAMAILHASKAKVRNTTASTNDTPKPEYGGAVFVFGKGQLLLENSVIGANKATMALVATGGGTVTTSGNNFIGNFRSAPEQKLDYATVGTAENPLDPKLDELGDYGGPVQTMRPLPGSPLIDTGVAVSGSVTIDARGTKRPLDGDADQAAKPDLGAVEYDPGDTDSNSE